MSIINMDTLWADIHTLHYADSLQYFSGSSYNQPEWKDRAVDTPNGTLMNNNSFFSSMQEKPEKVYLLHVTKDLDKIISSKTLYSSAGCLIGAVYTTQLFKEDLGFRMHNLGKVIYQREATLTSNTPSALIIEATYRGEGRNQILSGVDYLKLGTIHHAIYQNLRYLLTPEERTKLESIVSHKIKHSLDFISLCVAIENRTSDISSRDFVKILNKQTATLPILGYVYFEALAQFTMLYSQDEITKTLKHKGEFNNEIYKQFLLDIYNTVGQFKLSDFSISVEDIEKKFYLLEQAGRLNVDNDEFFDFIKQQVAHLATDLFLTNPRQIPRWLGIQWNYEGFSELLKPLVGHVIHRELRNFNRYKDFYFYFDQFKALSVWNYWNKMNIALPFNGPLQKGEIGINPAYPHVDYKIYTAIQNPLSNDHLIISQELDGVEIASRLVDLRHTAMRSQDHRPVEHPSPKEVAHA